MNNLQTVIESLERLVVLVYSLCAREDFRPSVTALHGLRVWAGKERPMHSSEDIDKLHVEHTMDTVCQIMDKIEVLKHSGLDTTTWEEDIAQVRESIGRDPSNVNRDKRHLVKQIKLRIRELTPHQPMETKPRLTVSLSPPQATLEYADGEHMTDRLESKEAEYLQLLIQHEGRHVGVRAKGYEHPGRIEGKLPEKIRELIVVEHGKGRRINTDLVSL